MDGCTRYRLAGGYLLHYTIGNRYYYCKHTKVQTWQRQA
jgi:hypothetical protein